jgi:magnesium chelatase family protein
VLQHAVTSLHLSARAYDRILKVARTIADLEEKDQIAPHHLQEAIGYRALDREIWR